MTDKVNDGVTGAIKMFNSYPPLSDWECELFGTGQGFVFHPAADGRIPNRFWRWMQYLAFGNRWVRVSR